MCFIRINPATAPLSPPGAAPTLTTVYDEAASILPSESASPSHSLSKEPPVPRAKQKSKLKRRLRLSGNSAPAGTPVEGTEKEKKRVQAIADSLDLGADLGADVQPDGSAEQRKEVEQRRGTVIGAEEPHRIVNEGDGRLAFWKESRIYYGRSTHRTPSAQSGRPWALSSIVRRAVWQRQSHLVPRFVPSSMAVLTGGQPSTYVLPHLRGRAPSFAQYPIEAPEKLSLTHDARPSTDPNSRVDAVGFFGLPGEIRNEIYRYGLTAKRNTSQQCAWSSLDLRHGQAYQFAMGLLLVNRQIYQEASPIFNHENGFVIVRDAQYTGLLAPLLQEGLPAIAVTRNFQKYNVVTMIFQFGGHIGRMDASYVDIQIIIAAKDFETFILIAFEMQWLRSMPPGVRYCLKVSSCSYLSSRTAKMELLQPLRLLSNSKTAIADGSFCRRANQSKMYLATIIASGTVSLFFDILWNRAEAKIVQNNHRSAAFYLRKMVEDRVKGFDINSATITVADPGQHIFDTIILQYRQAEASKKARRHREAHEAIKSAISTWREQHVPGVTDALRSEMCCLRAQLDETHGSLLKLQNATYWFQEALRYNPKRAGLIKDITRNKHKARVLEKSMVDEALNDV